MAAGASSGGAGGSIALVAGSSSSGVGGFTQSVVQLCETEPEAAVKLTSSLDFAGIGHSGADKFESSDSDSTYSLESGST